MGFTNCCVWKSGPEYSRCLFSTPPYESNKNRIAAWRNAKRSFSPLHRYFSNLGWYILLLSAWIVHGTTEPSNIGSAVSMWRGEKANAILRKKYYSIMQLRHKLKKVFGTDFAQKCRHFKHCKLKANKQPIGDSNASLSSGMILNWKPF